MKDNKHYMRRKEELQFYIDQGCNEDMLGMATQLFDLVNPGVSKMIRRHYD